MRKKAKRLSVRAGLGATDKQKDELMDLLDIALTSLHSVVEFAQEPRLSESYRIHRIAVDAQRAIDRIEYAIDQACRDDFKGEAEPYVDGGDNG